MADSKASRPKGSRAKERAETALSYAFRYGGTDGAHHKDWVIDQMVRALTGCPLETHGAFDVNGRAYSFEAQGKSREYKAFVKKAKAGEDGPDTYEWDEGIAP